MAVKPADELRVPQEISANVAAAPAGGTGAAAGGYDTAANRDLMIATVNAMRTALITHGFMTADA